MQRVTYHCNIRREDRRRSGVSNAIRAYEYLCKYDGTVPVDIVGSTRLYPTSRNFRKEYGDRSQWLAYLAVSAMPAPTYPIRLPDGDEADTPLASCKQRHLWIWGPASSGKTLWLEKNIVCFRNYRVAGTMYPSTTTTANKSSSMMMSSPKRNISSASAIRPPTPDPALTDAIPCAVCPRKSSHIGYRVITIALTTCLTVKAMLLCSYSHTLQGNLVQP